jgi:hypothetical protein
VEGRVGTREMCGELVRAGWHDGRPGVCSGHQPADFGSDRSGVLFGVRADCQCRPGVGSGRRLVVRSRRPEVCSGHRWFGSCGPARVLFGEPTSGLALVGPGFVQESSMHVKRRRRRFGVLLALPTKARILCSDSLLSIVA